MPKYSPERTKARHEEIIDACEVLYQTMSFNEITLKDIGAKTTFTRTSIYNYFHTKEEIFLALLQREHQKWIVDLNVIAEANDDLSVQTFADRLAHSLESRVQMLKLMSMNLYAIEDNSRTENLISFKQTYGESIDALKRCVRKYCPDMSEDRIDTFLYEFLPYTYGLYPYTFPSDKQREAMVAAGIVVNNRSIYDMAYPCIVKLLKNY